MDKRFVWVNGTFFSEDLNVLTVNNRSFAYGDGLFETMHAYGTTARHLDLHFKRLVKAMNLLEFEFPPFLNIDFLAKEISRTLTKNRIFGSARVRVTVFRQEGGLYTPQNNQVSMVIQTKSLHYNFYELNKKGLIIDLFTRFRKPINELSNIKSCNSLLYVMAGLHKKRLGVDECLIINDQNRVAESISSNLFFCIGNNLYTPSLGEGCVEGVMRQLLLTLAPQFNLKVMNDASVEPEDLLLADEMFLTNAINGIQWVVGFKERRYYNRISGMLSNEINRYTFPDQFKDGFSG